MCVKNLETTTKFASVLVHATRSASPPLETARCVLDFCGLVRFVRPHGARSSQTCANAVSHARPMWSTSIRAEPHSIRRERVTPNAFERVACQTSRANVNGGHDLEEHDLERLR